MQSLKSIKILNKDRINITEFSFNNRLEDGEACYSPSNTSLVLTAQNKNHLLFGFWMTSQSICTSVVMASQEGRPLPCSQRNILNHKASHYMSTT